MTDLLGVCTSWGDGECVDRPRVGRAGDIRLADIVSGKPVPPRPSVRHRVSPLRGAAARAGALPRPRDRAGRRLAAPPLPHRDRPARELGPGLRPAGRRRTPTSGVRRPLPSGRSRPCCPTPPRTSCSGRTAGWRRATTPTRCSSWRAWRRCDARCAGARGLDRLDRRRSSRRGRPGVVAARIGDVASGIAAYADDWVGFRSIHVDPDQRRRGLGHGGDGRPARVGRRAGRDHGVPPGAGRQRTRRWRCTRARASRPTTPTATWRRPAGERRTQPGLAEREVIQGHQRLDHQKQQRAGEDHARDVHDQLGQRPDDLAAFPDRQPEREVAGRRARWSRR